MAKTPAKTADDSKASEGEANPDAEPATERVLTKAIAAKLARISVKNVFAFKDHGDHVNVVTVAGQKIRIDAPGP